MKRFACVAAVCLVAILCIGGSSAEAQTASSADPQWYAELNAGPTLGHKSDAFFGVEAGYRLTSDLFIVAETGHMGNVGTTDLDERAAIIADFLGATASTAFKVNHVSAGLRYNPAIAPSVHPYVLGEIGFASVKTEVEFSANGSVIDPAARGVQLGGDLSGTHGKTMLVFGFGVNLPFKDRYFADLGYRFGYILAKTSNFETDTGIPTQRIILGAGIRF